MESERQKAKASTSEPENEDPELAQKMAEAHAKAAKISRQSGMEGHVHRLSVIALYVIGSVLVAAVFIFILLHLLPPDWRFLSDENREDLNGLLFSGVVGALVTSLAQRVLN